MGLAIESGRTASGRIFHASAQGRRPCVLVVEALDQEGPSLAGRLAGVGFEVRACVDGPAALGAFVRELPDLIVVRDGLEGPGGFELVRRVRELSDLPVVLVVSVDSAWTRDHASRVGVDHVLVGPGELESLPRVALDLVDPIRPQESGPRLTAAHMRRVALTERKTELERLLVECRGNLAEMARRMGKDRSTVRYHLRRFGMLAEERLEQRDALQHERAESARDGCGSASA